MKRALIVGAYGQDGSYLTEHLVDLGYLVFGMVRRPHHHVGPVEYLYGDLRDETSIITAIQKSWPDEIYNFGGVTSVPVSWQDPAETFNVNTGGLLRILRTVELLKKADTRIYQANSAVMFKNHEGACNEQTPLQPESPYGLSKAAAHGLCRIYRAKGLYVVSGMQFNHESSRRGHEGVTRKIACHVANWASGGTSMLHLGSLDSRRDWGFAGDYVKCMWLSLQQPTADDYVIGSGVLHSVKEFLVAACEYAGVELDFALQHVITDPRMQRTQELYELHADASKAKSVLGWEPEMDFESLVGMMVRAELDRLNATGKGAMQCT